MQVIAPSMGGGVEGGTAGGGGSDGDDGGECGRGSAGGGGDGGGKHVSTLIVVAFGRTHWAAYRSAPLLIVIDAPGVNWHVLLAPWKE